MPANGKNEENPIESGLSSTVNLCLKAIYEVYFQPQKEAVPYHLRISYSFFGSFMLLWSSIFTILIKALDSDAA